MTPGARAFLRGRLGAQAKRDAETAADMADPDLDIVENANGDLVVSLRDGPPPPPPSHRVHLNITREQAAQMAIAQRKQREADARWAARSREVMRLARRRK